MNDISPSNHPKDIAADWVVRINDPEVTEADLASWQSWLAEDPLHCDLYRRLDHVWSRSTQLPQKAVIKQAPVLSWKLAASVVFVLAGGVLAWFVQQSRPTLIETATAEQRSFRLDDGSRVELSAESALAVSLDANLRALNLKQGEAYFDVAPDAARPFVVSIGNHQVRALGTAFNIEKTEDRAVVTVTEGLVRLSKSDEPNGADSEPALELSAGDQAIIDSRGMHRLVAAAVDPQVVTAWRQGRFEYLHEELRYVVADVNRYVKRKIVVNDPQLAKLEFTGTVFLDNLDEWLVTLEGSFPVQVSRHGDERVVTRVAPPGATPSHSMR